MITITTTINATLDKVWDFWNNPKHITNWYFASPDWHCPKAENDLQVGKKFNIRMEAKDGSFGFDFEGEYTKITEFQLIEYILADNRKVITTFEKKENTIVVTQQFDPENENSLELQQNGWQAILNNFKKYTEGV
jgi:uncharacterized protein YndB with AHSA1/START domain